MVLLPFDLCLWLLGNGYAGVFFPPPSAVPFGSVYESVCRRLRVIRRKVTECGIVSPEIQKCENTIPDGGETSEEGKGTEVGRKSRWICPSILVEGTGTDGLRYVFGVREIDLGGCKSRLLAL
jgi:hypothetical protein